MRPATLILGGNVIAFALGVVVTVWIASTFGLILFSRAPVVPPAPPVLPRAATMTAAAEPPAATVLSPNAPAAAIPIMSDMPPPKAAQVPTPSLTEPTATAASNPSAPAVAGRYILQLGAFRQAANALWLQRTVRQRGFAAYIVPQESVGGILRMVQIGGFPDRVAAATGAASLRRQTGIVALIMKRRIR